MPIKNTFTWKFFRNYVEQWPWQRRRIDMFRHLNSERRFRFLWTYFSDILVIKDAPNLWCQIGDGFPREFPPPRVHYAGAACPWARRLWVQLTDTQPRRSVREVGEILEGTRPRSGITAPNECDVVRSVAPIHYANQLNILFSYYNYLY